MGHSGPLDAPIVLCGRDWGFEEQRAGRPFVGPAGKLLSRALAKAGIEREQCLITNVVNARPAGNQWEKHSAAELDRGVAALHQVLGAAPRRIIVALGAEAFQACCGRDPRTRPEETFDGNGITELLGYCFDGPFGPVLASTHPAFILRTWLPWWPCLCWDLAKAKRWTKGDNVAPLGQEHVMAYDVQLEVPGDATLAVDIETSGPHAEKIECIAFAWNAEYGHAYKYMFGTHDVV